ncbi:hypothetical protein AB0F17_65635 [Nonomuraea sp. NPDC026600]|uniref:hypothetical protein n=1 Tax=Nonomuraea sp. NPDC026600 TaxID=3155363 RepID=UPI0033CF1ACE
MAAPRRCRHCREPLRATARADALYCGPACRAAAARRRRWFTKAVRVGKALVSGNARQVSRRCPGCGHWFIPGMFGRRQDAIYDSHACRSASWRARRRAARQTAQPPRESVTPAASVTAPGTATRP